MMDVDMMVDLTREALWTGLLISMPVLVTGMVAGLLISLIQALTQIQDQTVSFVPKIAAMAVAIAFCLPWALQHLLEFSQGLFAEIPRILSGG